MIMDADEFDVYFEKAAALQDLQECLRQTEESTRRGSLPEDSTPRGVNLEAPTDKHRRTFSCKITRPPPDINDPQGEGHKSSRRHSSRHLSPGRRSGRASNEDIGRGGSSLLLSPNNVHNGNSPPEETSTSAPPSRSSSFKRMSRPRSMRDFQETYGSEGSERRRSSVNLEEAVAAKLDELQRLDDEDCCVVRSFATSPSGLVNRGDSFRRKSSSASRKNEDNGSMDHMRVPKSESLARILSRDAASQVVVMGDRRVGKTALLTQFMTSEYLAALDTTFESEVEKTISVHLNDVESLINVVEIDPSSNHKEWQKYHPQCYLLVYSITERSSFTYIVELLRLINKSRDKGACAVILVANKGDLVRKRQVPESEVKNICSEFGCKYIEVSAAINHKIDELLVGVVTQIRLREAMPQMGSNGSHPHTDIESSHPSKGAKGFLHKLFSKQKEEPRPCENLMVL